MVAAIAKGHADINKNLRRDETDLNETNNLIIKWLGLAERNITVKR